jgi:hypothetical protein
VSPWGQREDIGLCGLERRAGRGSFQVQMGGAEHPLWSLPRGTWMSGKSWARGFFDVGLGRPDQKPHSTLRGATGWSRLLCVACPSCTSPLGTALFFPGLYHTAQASCAACPPRAQ